MADPPSACRDCLCENCPAELQACEADEGCQAIGACVEESGCDGIGCLEPCGMVIDFHGGIAGKSAQLWLEVDSCSDDACPDLC